MPTETFVSYDGTSNPTYLVDSFLGLNSGIQIVSGSVVLSASASTAVNLYDGSLSALGIGAGLLLTSGIAPGTTNTVGWYGQDNTQYAVDGTPLNYYNGDAAIDAVVNSVFQTQSYDATTLSFDFTVTDPAATSISFDIVFGTDEYPEWVDQFVDCAVVIVNGVNYAYFNHDPNAPLSVIGPNLAAGYFQDNAGNILPIEYDGVSHVLKIVAPIHAGVNSIKIGIADTGDHIYDSGIFISNMVAGTTPGSGVVITPDIPCTDGDDVVSGTIAGELINLLGGDDTAYAGGGDDIVVAGAGHDRLYGGSGEDVLEGDAGDDYLDGGEGVANQAVFSGSVADYSVSYDALTGKYTVSGAEGSDTLVNVQLCKFAEGLFDLGPNGLTAHSDGSGPQANSPGTVVLSGASMVGQTLVALVIDADGLPGPGNPVSYHWLVSADGFNWSDAGVTGNSYTLGNADAGMMVMAVASYTDALGHAEVAASALTSVTSANTNLTMSLMELSAPAGASVENPLTTLLANAMAMGFTANQASAAIKTVLGLPGINLGSYDPLAVLAAHPSDATALQVMKICATVAMTVSVADPSGFNLTLAVMDAASKGQTIDLANLDQLSAVLAGVDPAVIDKVLNLNHDMAGATSLAGADGITSVWNDFCGKVDNLDPYMGHLEVINVHINQAPSGSSTASLPFGSEGASYTISAASLLAGFSDPDGDVLTVSDLATDPLAGGVLVDNLDGTWTFTPDAGFTGPVELTFAISDPSGASAYGSTLLVIAAEPPADTTAPTVTITDDAAGTATGDVTYTLTFSEAVTGLAAGDFTVTNGTVKSIAGSGSSYTLVVTPTASFEGSLGLALDAGAVSDAAGNANAAASASAQSVDTRPPTVTTISYGTHDGTLKAGETVTLVVAMSEAVTVSGTPTLALANGGSATYTGGSGTSTLIFSYTVAAGQDTADLATAASGALTGTITDAAGNGLVASGFNAVNPSGTLVVDTTAPTVLAFSPADATTGVAVASNIVVTFSEAIARGTGMIQLRAGSATGTIVESFDAATSARLTLSGSTLTIDPASTLAGNTQYFVTFAAGTVTDQSGNAYAGTQAYDFTTIATTTIINGTGSAETLNGTAGDDQINGLGGNDTLNGNAGNDLLDGGAGNDSMSGGLGDDLYVVDSANDKVIEATGQGVDTVRTALASYTLGANVENLVYSGAAAFSGTGNGLDNRIEGGAGNDTLSGGAGVDTLLGGGGADILVGGVGTDVLQGGAGSDIYIIAAPADHGAAEINDGGGTDELRFTSATAGATLALYAGDIGLERVVIGTGTGASATTTATTALNVDASLAANGLAITGNAGVNALTGSAFADTLNGGGGNDVISGKAGADVLAGGLGNDTLNGGLGLDSFLFDTALSATGANTDTIQSFATVDDTILLENAIFTALGATGALSAGAFNTGAAATQADDRIIYNAATGALLYDADGSGAGAAIRFATISGITGTLSASDFLIV